MPLILIGGPAVADGRALMALPMSLTLAADKAGAETLRNDFVS